MREELIKLLNAPERAARLAALKKLAAPRATDRDNVNGHIHTTYSFSPYSPSLAVYSALMNGLSLAGIMDHDSVAGAEEFIEAGKIAGVATTVGFECRCDMSGTPFDGKYFNNPDQASVAYFTMHGVPRANLAHAEEFLKPFRVKRNARNVKMVEKLNAAVKKYGIFLDYENDVAAASNSREGGGVTERHILCALALKLMEKAGRGLRLIDFLSDSFGIAVTGDNLKRLTDVQNAMYEYSLLNILKGELAGIFYIDAVGECPTVSEFIKLGGEIGAIPAYAYLGDVAGSVTGDKRDQKFEDGYLDEYVKYLSERGFRALTFMPARNTVRQLTRVIALCEKYDLFQISGEDINSPFQPFVCEAMKKPEYRHLVDSAWALVGHEKAENGMFSAKMIERFPVLTDRIKYFAELGES